MNNKLDEILDSYVNGQFTQMCSQIKAYGIRKFFLDLYPHERVKDYETYVKISDMFYRLRS